VAAAVAIAIEVGNRCNPNRTIILEAYQQLKGMVMEERMSELSIERSKLDLSAEWGVCPLTSIHRLQQRIGSDPCTGTIERAKTCQEGGREIIMRGLLRRADVHEGKQE
jgi:hypothetical protein